MFGGAIAAIAVAAGCGGAADPISKTHDVAARTVGRDLTVDHLSTLLTKAKVPVPLTTHNAVAIANLWSIYQRLGYAAAHNDSLESHIGAAMTPVLNLARINRLLETLRGGLPHDTATKAAYDAGAFGLYAIRHIVFAYPPKAARAQRDSVTRLAAKIRSTITAENFSAMAKRYSGDTASAPKGGFLGIFSRSTMPANVVAVVAALKPDSISNLFGTQFGVDVVQRMSWTDAQAAYVPAFARAASQRNDSTLIERMSRAAHLEVTGAAARAARGAIADPVQGSRDSTVIATFDKGGRFTAADLLSWVNIMDPSARAQVLKQLPQESDTVAMIFVRNVASRAVLVRAADSAKIAIPDSVPSRFRERFFKDVMRNWTALGVSPAQLADNAKTQGEREQVAANRINQFIERGMAGAIPMTTVSVPVEAALDAKYVSLKSAAAIARVVKR